MTAAATTITLELPRGVAESEARLSYAIGLFSEGKVSLGKASELSGISKAEFMLALSRRGIPVCNYDPEEIAQEREVLRRHLG